MARTLVIILQSVFNSAIGRQISKFSGLPFFISGPKSKYGGRIGQAGFNPGIFRNLPQSFMLGSGCSFHWRGFYVVDSVYNESNTNTICKLSLHNQTLHLIYNPQKLPLYPRLLVIFEGGNNNINKQIDNCKKFYTDLLMLFSLIF